MICPCSHSSHVPANGTSTATDSVPARLITTPLRWWPQPRQRRRWVGEVRAGDVEVAQLVERVFVEVGHERRSLPGEAVVETCHLLVARRGREVGAVVLG